MIMLTWANQENPAFYIIMKQVLHPRNNCSPQWKFDAQQSVLKFLRHNNAMQKA